MSLLVDKLSSDILASTNDLIYLIRSAPYRYKVYEIAKRKKGQKRTIAQPARELKRLQYWVMENVLRVCFINRCGLKLGSLHEGFALMNFLYEQEAIGAVERCAVGADRAAAA